MNEIQGETIGIDLGTTYSCVGIWERCSILQVFVSCVEIVANDYTVLDDFKSEPYNNFIHIITYYFFRGNVWSTLFSNSL